MCKGSYFPNVTGEKTGRTVKVVVADFSKENTFATIEEEIKDLNVGVLGLTFIFPLFICKAQVAILQTKYT